MDRERRDQRHAHDDAATDVPRRVRPRNLRAARQRYSGVPRTALMAFREAISRAYWPCGTQGASSIRSYRRPIQPALDGPCLDASGARTGVSLTKRSAVLDAQRKIDRALKGTKAK